MQTNTLEDPSEFDALAKLRPNEPFFPLVGRDPHAPPLVRQWATMERQAVHDTVKDPEEAERRLRKATDAEFISFEMDSYRKGQREVAEPVEARSSGGYSGHVLPPETEKRDQDQRSRIRASKHLSEAAAQAHSAIELMQGLGMVKEAKAVGFALETLAIQAEQIRPGLPIPLQPELGGLDA